MTNSFLIISYQLISFLQNEYQFQLRVRNVGTKSAAKSDHS